MKKIFTYSVITLIALCCIFLSSSINAFAAPIMDSTDTYGYEFIDAESIRIVKYHDRSNSPILVIPDTIDGYTVTEIGEKVFEWNRVLEEVVISDNIKYIGEGAFTNCRKIKKLTINGDNLVLGERAFSSCYALAELTISDNVIEIGKDCFHGPGSLGEDYLTSVTIPGSVKTIRDGAFELRGKLENVTLCEGIETIEQYAFSYTGITHLKIPDSVKKLGKLEMNKLAFLELGNGITTFEPELFYYCKNMVELKFTDNLDISDNEIIEKSQIYKTAWYENQKGCIVVGHNLIGYNYDETNKDAIIPDDVYYMNTNIGKGYALNKIIVPESVRELNCELNATEVEINCPITTLKSGIVGSNVQKLTLPSTVTTINPHAFGYSLIEVNMPDSITTISESAFYNCTALKSITIPPSVTRIENNTFWECDALESIIIPNCVTHIGDYAFFSCDSLAEITIPETVTQMGTKCFYKCTGLNKIEFNAKEVPENCFAECNSVYSITFGPTVEKIAKYAFFQCNELKSLTIPGNVKKIGDYAFSYCEKLSSVDLQEGIAVFSKACFMNDTQLKEVTIPNSTESIEAAAFGLEYYVERGIAFNWEYAQEMEYEATGYKIVSGFKMEGSNSEAKSYADRNGINYTSIEAVAQTETAIVEEVPVGTTIKSIDGIPVVETNEAESNITEVQADTQNVTENTNGSSGAFAVIVILLIIVIIVLVILMLQMKKNSNKNT